MSRNPREVQMRLQSTADSLQVQAQLPRKPLSQTLKDLIDYCKENADSDELLYPPRQRLILSEKNLDVLFCKCLDNPSLASLIE
ncbi:hypothetical protein EB796_017514 [Bugula neritina]|uniref:G protein gamma domain-containing protein n=1 Tax=Bugula neritina TaxID=10212 RepID=A0A7J7JEC0_BUGNE|nr:hypothetical protein EB796_017514 [Bugula neritina]